MNMNSKFLTIFAAFSLLTAFPGAASAAYPEDPNKWKFDATIYLWGASMGGNTSANSGVDVSFGDLLKDLEMAFMGAAGAQKDRWSLLGDFIYLDIEQKDNTSVGATPVSTKIDLKGWVINLVGGYAAVQRENHTLNVVAGARYLDLDTDLNFTIGMTPGQFAVSNNAWNGIIGVQGQADFARNWYFNYYLDVGAGDSDFTWQALAGFGYQFKHLDLKFGYRYLDWEFDANDAFGKAFKNLDLHGPYGGVKFKF